MTVMRIFTYEDFRLKGYWRNRCGTEENLQVSRRATRDQCYMSIRGIRVETIRLQIII